MWQIIETMGLFTTTHIHPSRTETELVPYAKKIKITEHRAPTDESIKLVNEMREKVLRDMVCSLVVEDNTLNAVMVFVSGGERVLEDVLRYALKFTLNGKEYVFEKDIPRREWHHRDKKDFMLALLKEKFAEVLATELMKDLDGRFAFYTR